jgi:hypothetical protein
METLERTFADLRKWLNIMQWCAIATIAFALGLLVTVTW